MSAVLGITNKVDTYEVWQWVHGPQAIRLNGDEVHLWRVWLDRNASLAEEFWSTLSADERQRAQRFRFDRDRRHFVSARGVLRNILGRYLQKSPAAISFDYNDYGKPAISSSQGPRFNVSHSNGAALYVFSLSREVGVDVELLRDDVTILEIAEGIFAASEIDALRSLPSGQQVQGFFNCWTRKEAYIKALGEGLTHPLDRFAVSLAPNEPAHLLNTVDDGWSLIDVSPFPAYAGAVAVSGTNPEIHCWDW